jgi:HPt (histidine-containing phosphotransfer) domain-containing protein
VAADEFDGADLVSAAVLDCSILQILGQLPGKRHPEFVDGIITLFIETALTLLADLTDGVAKNDVTALHHASHALKSCSAAIGAGALSARCDELELAARAGSVLDAHSRVEAIALEYRRLEASLIGRLATRRAAGQRDQIGAPLQAVSAPALPLPAGK